MLRPKILPRGGKLIEVKTDLTFKTNFRLMFFKVRRMETSSKRRRYWSRSAKLFTIDQKYFFFRRPRKISATRSGAGGGAGSGIQ